MYAYPVLLPEQSNREDFLRTVSLFDDDTGQALDLSGRTLSNPGDFVGNAWTVKSGTIITASVSPLTIKDYPIGNEMQALALTVGLGLAILPGANVTISDATGKNTMTGFVTSYVPATGAMVCQIGCAFLFEIRGHHHGDGYCDGYGSSSAIGTDDFSVPIIAAQLGSGITVIDLGRAQVRIPASTIQKLKHRTYGIAMALYLGEDTRQLVLGKQPIQYGGLSTMPLAIPSPPNPFGLP
jgi:hypothetical protein